MELNVQKREKFGKQAKDLMTEGKIPAEFYGKGVENMHLCVPLNDFRRIYKEAGETSIISLMVDGKKFSALIHDISRNPVTNEFTHADFYQVDMKQKLRVSVPLDFIGESPAIKEQGGLLVKSMQEVEIEALPADLPHDLKVDISTIANIGESVYVKDAQLPNGVRVITDAESVVASVNAPMTAEEEAALVAGDVSSVKVESEEKVAEREAKKVQEEK